MIICKSAAEIEKLRRSGRMVRQVLGEVKDHARPGATTMDLEKFVARRFKELGARSAFKGYRGYPCVLCASINEEVVHGIPSDRRVLKEGDILSLDTGVVLDGFYGDSAMTIAVGSISEGAQRLLKVTEEALELAIEQVRLGNRLGDVSATVQAHAEKSGYGIVREFVGHGIGKSMHEEPQIPNYGQAGHGPVLKEGMVFAIEPMVNAGAAGVRVLDDHWTAVTVDGQLSAHFEHMVAVTQNGPDVLTRL